VAETMMVSTRVLNELFGSKVATMLSLPVPEGVIVHQPELLVTVQLVLDVT
jgi:hypothetical protein